MRKKVVLLIVEGASDEMALARFFANLFDSSSVQILTMRGDITTRKGVGPTNIAAKLGNEVGLFIKPLGIQGSDIDRIIHIVDTDGAFIDDDKVVEDQTKIKPYYALEGIYTSNVQGIVFRNQQKSANLKRLRKTGIVYRRPYRVYYMSRCLDHVLYNKMNSTDEEKEKDSYDFAHKFKDDFEGCVVFFCDSPFSISGDYNDSWKYIEEGNRSLKRATNLAICINEQLSN